MTVQTEQPAAGNKRTAVAFELKEAALMEGDTSDGLVLPPQRDVVIVEVGPRDGLQNETSSIPTSVKIAFVNALADAGLPAIEVTSFVNPRAVPQLADAAEVMTGIDRGRGTRYSVLVPNQRG